MTIFLRILWAMLFYKSVTGWCYESTKKSEGRHKLFRHNGVVYGIEFIEYKEVKE